MAACAMFHEQCLAHLCLVAVNFAEHVLRPARRRQAFQLVLDPLQARVSRRSTGTALRREIWSSDQRAGRRPWSRQNCGQSGPAQSAPHCVHSPCGAFQRNGGLTGAIPVDQFSRIPVSVAVVRSTIMVRASMRPGPHGCGVIEVRVAYSCTRALSLSIRLRSLSFASGVDAPSRAAKRSNFAASVRCRLKRVVEASKPDPGNRTCLRCRLRYE